MSIGVKPRNLVQTKFIDTVIKCHEEEEGKGQEIQFPSFSKTCHVFAPLLVLYTMWFGLF